MHLVERDAGQDAGILFTRASTHLTLFLVYLCPFFLGTAAAAAAAYVGIIVFSAGSGRWLLCGCMRYANVASHISSTISARKTEARLLQSTKSLAFSVPYIINYQASMAPGLLFTVHPQPTAQCELPSKPLGN